MTSTIRSGGGRTSGSQIEPTAAPSPHPSSPGPKRAAAVAELTRARTVARWKSSAPGRLAGSTALISRRLPSIGELVALGRLERIRLRRLLRESSSVLIFAAGLVGAAGGAIASSMVYVVGYLHTVLFGLSEDAQLSAAAAVDPVRMAAALAIGGLLVGLLTTYRHRRVGTIVDPIEANALHGGRMSASDSAFVAPRVFSPAASALRSVWRAASRKRQARWGQ